MRTVGPSREEWLARHARVECAVGTVTRSQCAELQARPGLLDAVKRYPDGRAAVARRPSACERCPGWDNPITKNEEKERSDMMDQTEISVPIIRCCGPLHPEGKLLPMDDEHFFRNGSSSTGYMNQCKDCRRVINKEYRAKKKAEKAATESGKDAAAQVGDDAAGKVLDQVPATGSSWAERRERIRKDEEQQKAASGATPAKASTPPAAGKDQAGAPETPQIPAGGVSFEGSGCDLLVLDFEDYPDLIIEVKRLAREQIRTPTEQALYLIRLGLRTGTEA